LDGIHSTNLLNLKWMQRVQVLFDLYLDQLAFKALWYSFSSGTFLSERLKDNDNPKSEFRFDPAGKGLDGESEIFSSRSLVSKR